MVDISKIESIAKELGIKLLGQIPIDPEIAGLCDRGEFEKFNNEYLADAANYIEGVLL